MRVKSYRSIALPFCILVGSWVAAPMARAAFTDDFDDLRDELVSRSLALSNSTDKIEIKQKKLCDQSIVLIDKPSPSLAKDIKTAKKVATKMIKAFPNEFIMINAAGITFSNSIVTVLLDTYVNLGTDVQAEIVTLGGLIASLPDSPAKLKALAQFSIATNALALAQNSLTFAQGSALLGKSLRAALKGQTIANNAGGGGGGTASFSADVTRGGTNDHFVAAMPGGEWAQDLDILDIGGERGSQPNVLKVSVAICTNFTGMTGTYPLGDNCGGVFDFSTLTFYGAVSGTMVLQSFDPIAGTASGTFAYEASDGMTTIIVTNGMFNIDNLLVTP